MTRYVLVSGQEEALNKEFCLATEKIVGRQICDPTAALATLRQPAGAGDGVVIPEFSAARMFDAFSKNISAEIDVSFSELELRLPSRVGDFEKITGREKPLILKPRNKWWRPEKRSCVERGGFAPEKTKFAESVQPDRKYEVPPGDLPGAQSAAANLGAKGGK